MILPIAIVLFLAVIGLGALRPDYRRPFIWGGVFGLPLVLLQVLLAGSISRIGINWGDVISTLVAQILISMVLGALGAVAYDRWLGRWLTPAVHQDRRRLVFLTIGPLVTGGLAMAGVQVALAIVIGLLVNVTLTAVIGRHLIWDAWLSALGWAAWYVLVEIMVGVQTAGDIDQFLLGSHPLGITVASIPIEQLVIIAGVGALLGPLYAATKPHRSPGHKQTDRVNTAKTMTGLAAVLVLFGVMGWLTNEFVLTPSVARIEPKNSGQMIPLNSQIKIWFSRPIDRDTLEAQVEPAIDGTWKFIQPAIGQHGWRVAQYVFDTTLLPETTYTMQVSGIRSIWGLAGEKRIIKFTTTALPDVEGSDHGPTIVADPCQPIQVMLTDVNTTETEFNAYLTPSQPVAVTPGVNGRMLTVKPGQCLTAGTKYHLRLDRRLVVRSTTDQETVAIGDWLTVYETDFSTTAAPVVIPQTAPKILGQITSSGLTIVRPQKILPIKMDFQDQPLSCEAAALKMALMGVGVKVSEKQIMAQVGYDPTPHKGNVWGDPSVAFVGNIAGRQNTTGYGVYWGPIAKAANHWRPAEAFSNGNASLLTKEVAAGHPVVIWGVMGKAYATTWKTKAGKTIRAWKGEHARTVIGFNGLVDKPTSFIINDPIAGRLTWSTATLMKNWASFNYSGVIVR